MTIRRLRKKLDSASQSILKSALTPIIVVWIAAVILAAEIESARHNK
jgi:hypothetical protein